MYVPLTARLFCVLVGVSTMLQLIALFTQGWYIDTQRAEGLWMSGKNPMVCADPFNCDLMTSSYATKFQNSEISFKEYSMYVTMQTFSLLAILLSIGACVLSFLFSKDNKKIQYVGPISILLLVAGIMHWAVISNFLAMISSTPNETLTPFSIALSITGTIITFTVVGIHCFYLYNFMMSLPQASSAATMVFYEKHVIDENGRLKQQEENKLTAASCQVEDQKHQQYGSMIGEHGGASLVQPYDEMEDSMRQSKLSYSVILS